MVKKNESYDEMFNKLDGIVKDLESSELNLEESLKVYEEGVKLVNKLYKTLNDMEGKIKVINAKEEMKDFTIEG